MDRKLSEAILSNDMAAFQRLVQVDPTVLEQKTHVYKNTSLHLATGLGYSELVEEIVKLRPDLVEQENDDGDTPIHEACRRGNSEVLKQLLVHNPVAAQKVNHKNQSAFFIACSGGHGDAMKILLQQTWLMELEEDSLELAPLHIAFLNGHKGIVKETLQARPNFARTVNKNGSSILHLASVVGDREMTKFLVSVEPNLALQYNNAGYTPLQLAVIAGHITILETFYFSSPGSFRCLSKKQETVFHLAARFGHTEVFAYLTKLSGIFHLVRNQEEYGNTILHLAVITGDYQLVTIAGSTTVDVKCKNSNGQTALEIIEQSVGNEKIKQFLQAADDHSVELSLDLSDEQLLEHNVHPSPPSTYSGKSNRNHPSPRGTYSGLHTRNQTVGRITQNDRKKRTSSSSDTNFSGSIIRAKHKRVSMKRRKELQEMYKGGFNNREEQMQREALLNARNTITLVASLIATVTFAAGMNPPGGMFQDGQLKGKSTVGRTTAFKVFAVSNHIALFTSLCIVIVSTSIIPFKRKLLMRMLGITHKITWVAASFMATAYVAGTWVIMCREGGTKWLMATSIAIAAGLFGVTFFCLGFLATKHWLRKRVWREGICKQFSDQYRSINSDLHSGIHVGYHTV